jgi:hypothetical protein
MATENRVSIMKPKFVPGCSLVILFEGLGRGAGDTI